MFVGVDDTIIEVHGYAKQGSGYGYSGVRGLNAVLATASREDTAPVIIGQRLRKGAANSAGCANKFVTEALGTLKRTGTAGPVVCRFDSAYYGYPAVSAALAGGAEVSVTVRRDKAVKHAIAQIPEDAWTKIKYTNAVYDEDTHTWVSVAEVAEIEFSAFSSRKKAEQVPGRLVVRRIPELNPKATEGQPTLFDTHRFHAFFTTIDAATLDAVAADKVHRKHARIEQVNADLKDSALAHLPSGKFAANSAWLLCAVMAYNLTRTGGVLAAGQFAKARTGTIRVRIITIPARIASSARRIVLHLPEAWPWQTAGEHLFTATHAPPQVAQHPSTQPNRRNQGNENVEHYRQRGRPFVLPQNAQPPKSGIQPFSQPNRWIEV